LAREFVCGEAGFDEALLLLGVDAMDTALGSVAVLPADWGELPGGSACALTGSTIRPLGSGECTDCGVLL